MTRKSAQEIGSLLLRRASQVTRIGIGIFASFLIFLLLTEVGRMILVDGAAAERCSIRADWFCRGIFGTGVVGGNLIGLVTTALPFAAILFASLKTKRLATLLLITVVLLILAPNVIFDERSVLNRLV